MTHENITVALGVCAALRTLQGAESDGKDEHSRKRRPVKRTVGQLIDFEAALSAHPPALR